MHVAIYRFNPDTDDKPYTQNYEVNIDQVRGNMLLDVLEHIKATQDPSLGFRRSCGEGVCGSDGMNINGKNGLACVTPIDTLPSKVNLRPLPGFPVIRDLIVDMTNFYEQLERANPYLRNNEDAPSTERIQSVEQRASLDGLYECILCACCSSSCPSYWWNPDKFLGPAALLAANRFLVDSREDRKSYEQRLSDLEDAYSVFRCRSIMNCVDVCPKGLNPTKAISEIRAALLEESV